MKSSGRVTRQVATMLFSLATATAANQAFAQGAWETKAPMPTGRGSIATGVIDGRLYAVGGVTAASSPTTEVQSYDPSADAWTAKTPSPTSRGGASTGVIDGKLYLVGGCINSDCGSGGTNILERYDPVTNSWTTKAPMPTARHELASGVIDGKLYVVGGARHGNADVLSTLEVYNPVTNTWATKAPMPTARSGIDGAVIDGKLYVVGGQFDNTAHYLHTLEVYDPVTNTWLSSELGQVAGMPTNRYGAGAGVVNGILYAVGGG